MEYRRVTEWGIFLCVENQEQNTNDENDKNEIKTVGSRQSAVKMLEQRTFNCPRNRFAEDCGLD